MKRICSIQRGPPIIPNVISGCAKAAAIELLNVLQLAFVRQIMLCELASCLLQVSEVICCVRVHSVRLSCSFIEAFGRYIELVAEREGDVCFSKWSPNVRYTSR
jgi:hypothetical protein